MALCKKWSALEDIIGDQRDTVKYALFTHNQFVFHIASAIGSQCLGDLVVFCPSLVKVKLNILNARLSELKYTRNSHLPRHSSLQKTTELNLKPSGLLGRQFVDIEIEIHISKILTPDLWICSPVLRTSSHNYYHHHSSVTWPTLARSSLNILTKWNVQLTKLSFSILRKSNIWPYIISL